MMNGLRGNDRGTGSGGRVRRGGACPCCELRDGVYHDNAAYYDARFLTIREAAARIGVSHTTLYAWRKSGKLNATNGLVGNRFIDAENCPLLNHRPAELAA